CEVDLAQEPIKARCHFHFASRSYDTLVFNDVECGLLLARHLGHSRGMKRASVIMASDASTGVAARMVRSCYATALRRAVSRKNDALSLGVRFSVWKST